MSICNFVAIKDSIARSETFSFLEFLRKIKLIIYLGVPGGLPISFGEASQLEGAVIAHKDWTYWLVIALIVFFAYGVIRSLRTFMFARRTIRDQIDRPKPTWTQIQQTGKDLNRQLPFMLIIVPARNETAVIHNTISRLSHLDYPKSRFAVMIITDERETQENRSDTTYTMASRIAENLNKDLTDPFLYVAQVPGWYSGNYGDKEKTYSKSTKGRALNYGLDYLRGNNRLSQADVIGVLDADGRLHTKVLRETAHRYMQGDKLLQGPVFQISNFQDVGLIGKAMGIELSIYHLSTLSRRLLKEDNSPVFLAGTNYFIDRNLISEVGGWDTQALVEDAELGLRLFLRCGVRGKWLSCFEIEQTPPDLKTYLKQRERWTLGHLQLLPTIGKSALPLRTKIYLQCKILNSILKSITDVGLPILSWMALALGWTVAMPTPLGWIMLGLLVGSLFVWDFFGRGTYMLNKYAPRPLSKGSITILRIQFILAMPWLMLLQIFPRIKAFFKFLFKKSPDHWEKTIRTIEEKDTEDFKSLTESNTSACTIEEKDTGDFKSLTESNTSA
jgi:cellulose synthase/poly-beta-1,6-N-acetylglucosamine synthase-like glycosyltransferase